MSREGWKRKIGSPERNRVRSQLKAQPCRHPRDKIMEVKNRNGKIFLECTKCRAFLGYKRGG